MGQWCTIIDIIGVGREMRVNIWSGSVMLKLKIKIFYGKNMNRTLSVFLGSTNIVFDFQNKQIE